MSKYINQYNNYAAYSGDSRNFFYPHAAYLQEEKIGMYDKTPARFYQIYGKMNDSKFFYRVNGELVMGGVNGGTFFATPTASTITSLQYFFQAEYHKKTTKVEGLNIDTSSCTNMSYMFNGCSALISVNVSQLNTSNVTVFDSMFTGCNYMKTIIGLENLNTSSATSFNSMFNNCRSLETINVSGFNTVNVTNMASMFSNCRSVRTLDLSNFNTSGVTYSKWMFKDCINLQTLNISNWDMSNMPNNSDGVQSMFNGCSALTSLYMNNTSQSTFERTQSSLVGVSVASHVTIHRDGYAWTYSNGTWSSTPE